ncbi:hypothetical protein MKR24_11195 [Staphylococcus haemolyticus]|nr:hypothetical protein [Staphylococcus haemolyticus]
MSLYKEKIGLFTGVLGIGYQLARYLKPNILSVFLFEI